MSSPKAGSPKEGSPKGSGKAGLPKGQSRNKSILTVQSSGLNNGDQSVVENHITPSYVRHANSSAFVVEGNGAITGREASSFDYTPTLSQFDLSNCLPKCLRENN